MDHINNKQYIYQSIFEYQMKIYRFFWKLRVDTMRYLGQLGFSLVRWGARLFLDRSLRVPCTGH